MDAQASGQIDGYFVIPKGPRDEEFHGGISEQLSEWTWVSGAVSIDVVRIFMDAPSADSARIIDFLDRSGVPHRLYPTDSPVAAEMLAEVGPDAALPLVQLVGGAILPCPSTADLAGLMQRAARSTAPDGDEVADLLIVGAGPAGLAAAVYGASEGLSTVVIEADAVGGQAGTSSMRGRHVVVVGGGNSAGQAAVHLSRFAASVTVVIRRPRLDETMSTYLIHELAGRHNVVVRPCTEVIDGGGDGVLEWLVLRDLNDESTARVEASGLYLLLGAEPHCEWLPEDVCRDEYGFVLAGRDVPERFWTDGVPPAPLATAVPGVFVAGDIRSGSMKRVAAATGEGSSVVGLVHAFLGD